MQKRIRILLSMMLVFSVILSLATGALATEQEHVHNWQRTKANTMFHTMVCSGCGESKTITHTFDGTECCSVCGYQVHECVWQYGGHFYDDEHEMCCTKCDATTIEDHNYGSDGKCTVCGQPPPHIHDWKWDGKHENGRYHTLICACGQTATEDHKIVWDGKTYNDFGHKMSCSVCRHPDISWYYAHNIYEDGICNVCGYGGKDTANPPANSTNTNTAETKAEESNTAVTKPPETGSTESSSVETKPTESIPVETQLAETKSVATETISENAANGDLQPSSTKWIWVAAVIVAAGGLGVAVFILKKKLS